MFFSAMLFRGARLLNYDVRERQRDLDAASARLNRRVAALTAETETTAKHAEAAEKRANVRGEAVTGACADAAVRGAGARRRLGGAGFPRRPRQADQRPGGRARPRVASPAMLSARAILGPQTSAADGAVGGRFAPERLLLTFDNLDALHAGAGARPDRDSAFPARPELSSRRSPAIRSLWRRRPAARSRCATGSTSSFS